MEETEGEYGQGSVHSNRLESPIHPKEGQKRRVTVDQNVIYGDFRGGP